MESTSKQPEIQETSKRAFTPEQKQYRNYLAHTLRDKRALQPVEAGKALAEKYLKSQQNTIDYALASHNPLLWIKKTIESHNFSTIIDNMNKIDQKYHNDIMIAFIKH
jgi:hypothetical protein